MPRQARVVVPGCSGKSEPEVIKPSCYSCRQKFEPSELRVSYSKNYCERCGVGLFGEDYFSFNAKPAPTVRKNLAVHFAVLLFGVAGLLLWLLTGWS